MLTTRTYGSRIALEGSIDDAANVPRSASPTSPSAASFAIASSSSAASTAARSSGVSASSW